MVAADITRLFQCPYAPETGWRRNTHPASELHISHAAIYLQVVQDFEINLIQFNSGGMICAHIKIPADQMPDGAIYFWGNIITQDRPAQYYFKTIPTLELVSCRWRLLTLSRIGFKNFLCGVSCGTLAAMGAGSYGV